ncbi:MAG TPA: enoyl-CoA hydratase/isomerase family protein [Candidatus Eisenbacteria bacterium]|nr:enoyl-CoA hydratase/isomerase family protein [Candidatus Eisenbacteria bacterium]
MRDPVTTSFQIEEQPGVKVLRMISPNGTNTMTRAFVQLLAEAIEKLTSEVQGLVITGNDRFFSAGAELEQIAALGGATAYEFANMGQMLMRILDEFPAPVYAAIGGYCMGGGLDLALACRHRIASPHAVFGHRGAALGLITGWGGTQRLPRLIGRGRALEMFVAAERVSAVRGLQIGLVDAISEEPVQECVRRILETRKHGE